MHFDAAMSVLSALPFFQLNFSQLSPLQIFFLRRLTFNDIIAATTLCRTPVMFLRHIHNLNIGLGVHNLVGCSDQTLAVINRAAELEVWKLQRRSNGELSIGDLYKKGTSILLQLWDGGGMAEGAGPIVAEIYRCSASIYVNVVMSGIRTFNSYLSILGAFPGIDEIKKAIPFLVKSIKVILPHTDALGLVCWPIIVGTCSS